jgi:hypothetical protein
VTAGLARVAAIVADDAWSMEVLRAVRAFGLADWAVGAGFVRSLVWDRLDGLPARTVLTDVDVLTFDPADTDPETDAAVEAVLRARRPDIPWQVRNQARMHVRNGDAPYASIADAMAHWLETPTAVAVRLEPDDRLAVIAPFGVEDLLAKVIRPTPAGVAKADEYRARVHGRGWAGRWRDVTLLDNTSPR